MPIAECPWTTVRLAAVLDHTLLAPDATTQAIDRLCEEARTHRFAAVCVNGGHVPRCVRLLEASGIPVSAVVGFPLGAGATAAKEAEARIALDQGAGEMDMVMNLGALKDGDLDLVRRDLEAVIGAATEHGARAKVIVKVILETGYLSPDEVAVAARIAVAAGALFVKTSTGFGPRGAKVEDVRLLRATVGPGPGIKAAGGIRTRAFALELLEAGATRLGCSASLAILGELPGIRVEAAEPSRGPAVS